MMRELEVSAIIYPVPQTDRSLHGLALDTTSRGFAMTHKLSWIAAIFATLALLLVTGCQQNQNSPAGAESEPVETSSKTVPPRERTIVLGDIDADELANKIERFKPLANHLANNLGEYGIEAGRVVIAHDMEEMARLLTDGEVDLYFDSAFPALRVQEISGSEVIARRWKQGGSGYWSVFITAKDSGIIRPDDFTGKVIAHALLQMQHRGKEALVPISR